MRAAGGETDLLGRVAPDAGGGEVLFVEPDVDRLARGGGHVRCDGDGEACGE